LLLRLATRGSQLALWQAERVAHLLRVADPGLDVELVPVSTVGDRELSRPVREMGGQGVFVSEVQAAVVAGMADAAVHSAKDLQPRPAPGLVLAAFPERADARDALVGARLGDLEPGAVVATGSQRRKAQLAALRPDLRFVDLRGNIGTRLGRVPPGGAVVVAVAALVRLGLELGAAEVLGADVMLPQVAQGAIAVECREGDAAMQALLGSIDRGPVRVAVEAERSFLAELGGSCDLPVAGHATLDLEGNVELVGLLASPDGTTVVRRRARASQGEAARLGRHVAGMVLGEGGAELLTGYGQAL